MAYFVYTYLVQYYIIVLVLIVSKIFPGKYFELFYFTQNLNYRKVCLICISVLTKRSKLESCVLGFLLFLFLFFSSMLLSMLYIG